MNIQDLADELFGAFADRIGMPLSENARALPYSLRLAPEPVPWSRVFKHDVTLGAPALFAEAMPGLSSALTREAVLAHLLAVIDAFGTDRIEDGQIEADPSVFAVLGQARRERDRAMVRLLGRSPPPDVDFRLADETTIQAIRCERAALLSATPVDLAAYETASLAKQSVGILASVGLARAAGWDERRCLAVRWTLESVWLGLQMADDVVDWQDDQERGGAWAVCLMRGRPPAAGSGMRLIRPRSVTTQVLQSGVLGMMLSRASFHMRSARRRAIALGAHSLASWAGGQEQRLASLAAAEDESAGYAVRAHALAAWASEVLA